MGNFYRRSSAAYSAVLGRNWPKFKLIRDMMVVLLTSNNEQDPIKNEGARVLTRLFIIFRCSRAGNSAVAGGIPPKFELIHALIVFLVTCKNKEDPIKNEGATV